ncbi:MAG: chromate transporter [Oscillospiraceae bacterium]|nr:chromate transporter [Candidatus Limimonas coprohippi]
MNRILLMCLEFFKAGLFSIGGGLATLPFLQKMADNHPDWFTHDNLIDMVAVAESTPGPIGVNVATYAGFSTNGLFGGILSTLSLILPSFLCILIIYGFWQRYKENNRVQRTFAALRPAGLGLICAACFTVFKGAVIPDGGLRLSCLIMFVIFFALMQIPKMKKIHPLFYILFAALIGVLLPL